MKVLIRLLTLLAVPLAIPCSLSAQAWLPPKGEGFVSLTYQNLYVRNHLDYRGQKEDVGHIKANNLLMGVSYGITDRLALSIELPYIFSKYSGPFPESDLDDGSYHRTFQDFRFDLRYNALQRPFVLTPFFAAVLPSHGYGTVGHAAAGRDLREYQVGMDAGRQLGPFLPRAYVNAQYSYAFVQGVEDFNLNRSRADFEVGYFVTRSFSLRGLGSWQWTYGGIEFSPDLEDHPEHFGVHDRAARANFTRLGGGAAFSVNRSVDIYAAVVTTVAGRNGHAPLGIALGMSWTFSKSLLRGFLPIQSSANPFRTVSSGLGRAIY